MVLDKVENGRDNSWPDLPGFLHLTCPFPYSRKNPETRQDAGRKAVGSGRKRASSFPARILGFPFSGGKDPDLTRILHIRVKPNNGRKGPSIQACIQPKTCNLSSRGLICPFPNIHIFRSRTRSQPFRSQPHFRWWNVETETGRGFSARFLLFSTLVPDTD